MENSSDFGSTFGLTLLQSFRTGTISQENVQGNADAAGQAARQSGRNAGMSFLEATLAPGELGTFPRRSPSSGHVIMCSADSQRILGVVGPWRGRRAPALRVSSEGPLMSRLLPDVLPFVLRTPVTGSTATAMTTVTPKRWLGSSFCRKWLDVNVRIFSPARWVT